MENSVTVKTVEIPIPADGKKDSICHILDSEEKRGTLRMLLRQFCVTSSMRSVPRIVRAPTGVQRALWVCALLLGVLVSTYQLYRLLILYLSYRTSINMVYIKDSAPFPDVTVCNLNPLWVATSSKMNVTWTYEEYLKKLNEFFGTKAPLTAEKMYQIDSLQTYEGFLQYFTQEDLNQAPDYLVWGCRWEYKEGLQSTGSECSEHVARHVSPYYGPCSTFHMEGQGSQEIPSRLSILLFVNDFAQGEIKDFILSSYFTYSSGVRLLIHPPGTFPLMTDGINIPPGYETTLKVHSSKRTLMGPPYDDCVKTNYLQTRYGHDESYTYTKQVCQRFCQQDFIISSCGCVDPYSPLPKSYRDLSTPFCGFLDFENPQGVNETLNHLECLLNATFEGICECSEPCSQYIYDMDISQVPWPQINYHMAFYRRYIAPSPFAHQFAVYEKIEHTLKRNKEAGFRQLRETDLIRRNFLEISVHLDLEHTTVMEDNPVLSLEGLFGTMGGIFNLWVGITFITFIEVIDLLWTCLSKKENRHLIQTNPTGRASITSKQSL